MSSNKVMVPLGMIARSGHCTMRITTRPPFRRRETLKRRELYWPKRDDGWREGDLGITGWGARPYPQFYLDVMLVSGAKWNESHFSDAEFDALAATAGTTLDEEERIKAYSDIQHLLIERGPIIIPYYFAQFGAISDNFTGLSLNAFAGRTDFRPVRFVGN